MLMVVSLLSAGFVGTDVFGQLIVVRPGYVRAPFVRVIRQADGSTYVRAPFVRVNSPPRVRRSATSTTRRTAATAATESKYLAEMDWKELRAYLTKARRDLDRQLTKLPTGEVWRNYFLTREPLLAEGDLGALTADERKRVTHLLGVFDKAAKNDDLKAIVRTETFVGFHAALHEMLAQPVDRLRNSLAIAAHELQQQLTRIRPSRRWQSYLAVPSSVTGLNGTSRATAIDIDALVKTIERYDAVVDDPDDGAIRALPAFGKTHERLKHLRQFVTAPSR